MFETRLGNHLVFATLAIMIAGSLLRVRYEFPPRDQLLQCQGQVVDVRFDDGGSGSINIRSSAKTERYHFAWDITDVFSEAKPGDKVRLLADERWVVSVKHNGHQSLSYSEYIYRRSRNLFAILAFAGLTMIVNLVAYMIRFRSLGVFGLKMRTRPRTEVG